MSDPLSCGTSTCSAQPGAKSLALGDALRRLDQEAARGSCDNGRYRCRYLAWGQGPPLIFIHGLADTPHSFVLPIAMLSDQFQCVAYDLPSGKGDGARLAGMSHADLVEDLLSLLDHLGLQKAYLFGSSFGSTVALAAAARQPARFPRIVLQAGFATRPLSGAERLLARLGRHWPSRLATLPLRRVWFAGENHRPFRACPPEILEFYLANSGDTPMAAMAHRALLIDRLDLRPLLASVAQPTLLIGGDHDPVVGRKCEEELLSGLPNVGRLELPNCGHLPYLTHAAQVAEAVRQFLTPPCAV